MEDTLFDIYSDIERAIDLAFEGRFVLKFYDYLKIKSVRRREVDVFIESITANNINTVVMDLDDYLEEELSFNLPDNERVQLFVYDD